MSRSAGRPSEEADASQLTLKVWHPNCWTLEVTDAVDAGLVAHGVYEVDEQVYARLTTYANTTDQIREMVEVIENSSHTKETRIVHEYFTPNIQAGAAGNTTEELLVKYPSRKSIHDAFVSRGFVPEDEIRVYDGYEYWTVIITETRAQIQRRLDEVRDEMSAEISIEGLKSPDTKTTDCKSSVKFSERQREVFHLAQQEGYYEWPRQTSASELADQLEISKTTLLEHLRKAEAKLLGP